MANKRKLNPAEKILQKIKSSQFKLRYQFREYHFNKHQLIHSAPKPVPSIYNMKEAIRTIKNDQPITLITVGNPAYPAGIHFINMTHSENCLIYLKKVIGLQNLDSESEEFRPYKQLIERLNRIYKTHIRAACGFNSKNGAISLTTLFVTHYNFIRPHSSCPLWTKNLNI